MVDSRAKGRTAELKARDMLRKLTGHTWERIPASGALNEVHGLKGDLYIPQKDNLFCIEIKHYKEDQFNTKLLSSKSPKFIDWWDQTIRQAEQVKKVPLLIFKYDRSKWFVAYNPEQVFIDVPKGLAVFNGCDEIMINLLEEFCDEWKDWIK